MRSRTAVAEPTGRAAPVTVRGGAIAVNAPAVLAGQAEAMPAVAVASWLQLIGVSSAVLGVVGVVAWWQHRRMSAGPRPAYRFTPDHVVALLADADALGRWALSAAAAAADAEWALIAARVECQVAQEARETAWNEYDLAQRAYMRGLHGGPVGDEPWQVINVSGAWPVLTAVADSPAAPATPPAGALAGSPGGALAAPRAGALAGLPVRSALAQVPTGTGTATAPPGPLSVDVSRAAFAAYRRGDISVDELRAVFVWSSGWDSELERRERAVLRGRVVERDAHRRYDAAAAAERVAYRGLDIADAAARAWADEAAVAAAEAQAARVFADECRRHTVRRRRLRR
ncbi:MAG: hypothetical protein QOE03_4130 [Micromonosporaceae bacterium]|nr:hypothetical protein [Micromonosporaceae bacterium]